jgi:hypothetical protein
MCHCWRHTGAVASPAASAHLEGHTQRLFDLFRGEVFVALFDEQGNNVFVRGSTGSIEGEFRSRGAAVGQAVIRGEAAIRHTMDSCRQGATVLSFRLSCHSSQVFVAALSEMRRLLVISRGGAADQPPDFDQTLRDVCEQIRASVSGPFTPPRARE